MLSPRFFFFCSKLTCNSPLRTQWQWHSLRRRTTNINTRWYSNPRHTIKAAGSPLCTYPRPFCYYFHTPNSDRHIVFLTNPHKSLKFLNRQAPGSIPLSIRLDVIRSIISIKNQILTRRRALPERRKTGVIPTERHDAPSYQLVSRTRGNHHLSLFIDTFTLYSRHWGILTICLVSAAGAVLPRLREG